MRTKGAITKKECFNCKVVCNDEILQDRNYITLKDVAEDLGMTYNQVVEITRNRKKMGKGKYDTQYLISNLNKKNIGKIKQKEDFNLILKEEIIKECLDDEGNIIDEFLYENAVGQMEKSIDA